MGWRLIGSALVHDAQNLPDNRIRDMCGNSFHPALICSALGETSIREKWMQGEDEQNQNAPMTRVATKAESHAVYAELVVDKVAKRLPSGQLLQHQYVL